MADYNSKTSVLKAVRWPQELYDWLTCLPPKDKDFSAKVIGIVREKSELKKKRKSNTSARA